MTYRLRNIVIAVALAVLAAMIVSFYVKQQKEDLQQGQTLTTVYVAKDDIPVGTPGSEIAGMVADVQVAKDAVAPAAIVRPEDLEGKVSTQEIYANEQITLLRFADPTEQGIRAKLSGTLRAIQVPGDEHQLLAGTLKDGDRVDVVGYWVVPDCGACPHYSRTVLRDILVLQAPLGSEVSKRLNAESDDKYALLALTDAQSQKLWYIMKNGDWSLELRPTKDPADSPESAEKAETLLIDGMSRAQLQSLTRAGNFLFKKNER